MLTVYWFLSPLCAFTQHVSKETRIPFRARAVRVTSYPNGEKTHSEPSGLQECGHCPSPDVWTQLSPVTLVTTGLRSLTAACPPRVHSCQESCRVRGNVVSQHHYGHMQYKRSQCSLGFPFHSCWLHCCDDVTEKACAGGDVS
ncbi:hypothetical protein ILYODFUR_001306 [Ilyodon furcidens]|uniref:Secreted protein n=1 Tax=Ilyodon furcidens TaxID=33524 RepID=A0ABV0TSR1_9TELE